MTWLERYRQVLEESASGPLQLDGDQAGALLRLAREVAHGTERRYAPLATFLAGQFVAARAEQGADFSTSVEEALALARQVLTQAGHSGDRVTASAGE